MLWPFLCLILGGADNLYGSQPLERLDVKRVLRNSAQRPAVSETALNVAGFTYVNDSEALLDDLLETKDASFELDERVRQLRYRSGDEDRLIGLLRQMDGHSATAQAGLSIVLAAPALEDHYSLSLNTRTRFAGTFYYDSGDERKLRLAPVIAFIELAELDSHVEVSGVGIGELALHRVIPLAVLGDSRLSVSLKHQEIWLYERDVQIRRHRERDLFRLNNFTRKFSRANVDFAVSREWKRWTLGLTLRDLFESTYRGLEGSHYHLRTRAELQLDYALDWGRVSLDRDLNPQPAFGVINGRRETRVGLDVPVGCRFGLGVSYLAIERDRDADAVGVKVAYHLPQGFHLQFVGNIASRNELGGSFQIQLPLF
ncbi:MAG: hypothetical protein ACI89D_001426 [Bermanella sp.]|jgi:hypothetical protein